MNLSNNKDLISQTHLRNWKVGNMNELENIKDVNIDELYNKIVDRIETAKINVAVQVNKEMTILYWNIGKDIKENILNYEKAE